MPNFPEFYYCVFILEDGDGGTFLTFSGYFPDSIQTQMGPNEYQIDSEIWVAINDELFSNSVKYPATAVGKAALEAFIAKALSDKSLTAEKINEMPIYEPVEVPEGILYWYENGEIRWDYGFGESGYNEAKMNELSNYQMEWWNTNFLENHLISLGVKESTRYSKIRAVFSNNNTRMTASNYYTGTPENEVMEWDSVAAAKAATAVLVDPDYPDIMLTR